MPDFNPELNNQSVRKWAKQKLCVGPRSLLSPDPFASGLFGVDHLPIAVPAGFLDLGYITTDGVTDSDSISAEGTQMLQTLDDVRRDLTARERTLSLTFGERNAWTRALRAGVPFEDWPVDKYGATDYVEGMDSEEDFEELVWLLYKQDYTGPKAVFGVEVFFRGKITSLTDRTRSRTAVDGVGLTISLLRDDVFGVKREAEDGPGIGAGSTLPQVATITPAEAVPGDLVRIDGSHLGTATDVTFAGTSVADLEVASASTLYAIVPSVSAGTTAVVVSSPAGDSATFSYEVGGA
ncbi:IPT/TIG domain-containing protein [Serinibacter salmoneus]|uniref:IPT/TIG domain-containing protein n=1 Tax=Serinibacter salmoneus TaxID=556530 RepID=A0A2A9CZM7_9MICO|nr:IPT/TIG domain-containing protein [Serinibacter salmoneus]PFG19874.1 IPT/TIG domain-containing protein [Serinibacter salmoneus]